MFEHLLSPLQVGRLALPNRVLITAHATNYVDGNGLPDERAVHYYAERTRGGAGLMVTGASSVHPSSPRVRGVINAHDPQVVGAWRAIADAVHVHGGHVLVMLTHMGRVGRMPDMRPLVAPSPLMDGSFRQAVPHALSDREIGELVEAFAEAAVRVCQSGMDGIELQGAHGYLIAQFLSPLSNRRTDRYGGDLAGRMRFCLEVVDAVRRAAGSGATVGIRLSADELVPGGLGLDESRAIVRRLEASGQLDFVDVSAGTDSDLMSLAEHIPSMYFPPANLVRFAAAIKPVTRLPVFCAGAIRDPAVAEEIVASGKADMVGMTRAHIADPHVVRKLREGRSEDIRRCIGCMQACLEALANGLPIGCVYNPVTGREGEWATIEPASRSRRVVVVGGGPAGLEAARVAALRGHRVVLLEASKMLGGQLHLAARLPKRENFLEPRRGGRGPGGEPGGGRRGDREPSRASGRPSRAPGVTRPCDGCRERRGPRGRQRPGGGSGRPSPGFRGGRPLGRSGQSRPDRDRAALRRAGHRPEDVVPPAATFARSGDARVEMRPSTRFAGWDEGRPVVADVFTRAERTLGDIDTVVWAAPGCVVADLVEPLRAAGLPVHAVGDCVAPRRVEHAVHEAHAVARVL